MLQACCGHCTLRIGHGTFLHRYEPDKGHEEIEDLVVRWKIPVGMYLKHIFDRISL